MTLAVFAGLYVLTLAAFLWREDRRERRWAHERWELWTRIQAPHAAAQIPPPAALDNPPAPSTGRGEPDESDLIGTVNGG